MFYRFLLIIFVMLTFMNCQSQKNTTAMPVGKNLDGVVYLKEGENKFLQEQQMNITFMKVIEDSRCPKGTQCIWQGVGTVELQMMGVHSRPITFQLNTITAPRKRYTNHFNFNGYSVSLDSMLPYPTENSKKKNNNEKYIIGLKFTKGETINPRDARPASTNQ